VKIRRVKTGLNLGVRQERERDSSYLPERRDPKLKLNIRALLGQTRFQRRRRSRLRVARLFKRACSAVGEEKRKLDDDSDRMMTRDR